MIQQIKILNQKEKKKIESALAENFGIEKIPGQLVKKGEERIFLFRGNLTEEEIRKIEEVTTIEAMGVYFAKEQEGEIRLSLEGVFILKNQIKKNIFEMNELQLKEWIRGNELNIQTGKRGYLIMSYKGDFFGCGKASMEKISNFVPKTRRIKSKS
jgi:NOL1/NOP2/fmu family ribosome biogenesis protein